MSHWGPHVCARPASLIPTYNALSPATQQADQQSEPLRCSTPFFVGYSHHLSSLRGKGLPCPLSPSTNPVSRQTVQPRLRTLPVCASLPLLTSSLLILCVDYFLVIEKHQQRVTPFSIQVSSKPSIFLLTRRRKQSHCPRGV